MAGQNGMRRRIKAVRDKFTIKSEAFEFIGQAPALRSPDCVAALTQEARLAADEMKAATGLTLGLIVIDTTAASMPGGNENAGEGMSVLLDHVRQISDATSALVLLVGHTGKNEDLGVRGWSGQIGNSDAILYLTKDKEDPKLRHGVVHKLKDGERFAYRLRQIEMGVVAQGDAVTSAYPAFEEPPSDDPGTGRKKPALKDAQKISLRALRIMIEDGPNEPAPALAGVRAGTRAVKRVELREHAKRIGYAGRSPAVAGEARGLTTEATERHNSCKRVAKAPACGSLRASRSSQVGASPVRLLAPRSGPSHRRQGSLGFAPSGS